MSVGKRYRDTWACDDSDKSPRRQNKARLPQICFQCSSVGELDDGWTGTGRNASVSKLLTIIKTCSFSFPFAFPFFLPSIPLQSCCLQPISFHFKLPSFVSYACSMCFSTNLQHLGYWSWYIFMVANKYNATIISSLLLFLFFFIHYLLPASFLSFIPGWILISVMPSFC